MNFVVWTRFCSHLDRRKFGRIFIEWHSVNHTGQKCEEKQS